MQTPYLFTSQRLGFRPWNDDDIPKMAAISADPKVMEFFPATATLDETTAFIKRMQLLFSEKQLCYFAVEKLNDGQIIGFIGFGEKTFESFFTPCFDIGWRLAANEWNQGYATEGAQRCLKYAFDVLKLSKVHSIASEINLKSIHIMEKIGMAKVGVFMYPALEHDARLKDCVVYELDRNAYMLR